LVAAALLAGVLPLAFSSCAVRRRVISRLGGKSPQALRTADAETLLNSLVRQYDAIKDFTATVDMTPALGSAEKNKITEYKDVRAYILFRKPADIRLIGLYPIIRSKAFDMVSNGTDFKLYIPSKNRFLIGKNELDQPSPNKLENLRPQHFLDALLVKPVATPDKVLLENYTDEENAFYILHEVHELAQGRLLLQRTIWFDRTDLKMARQLIFDANGNILTDARYDDWKEYDGAPFPSKIAINRPRDEYGVVIEVVRMNINEGQTDDKFVLNQPEGTTLQVVGQPSAPSAPAPVSRKKTS
jgi:outer membrane lipoprotein-sorting protein